MTEIGKLITTEQGRDAIHIAVAPMIARGMLSPGQHVGIVANGVAGEGEGPMVGIVDPFLIDPVTSGQRFYLFLYPNTITSLRHEWTHPSFSAEAPNWPASEAWLRQFAEDVGLSYGAVMKAADEYVRFGEYHVFHGYDTPDRAYDTDFWRHYEIITGTTVEDHAATFFTCSC